jgi:DNA-binding transcriptional LysR family regulator
MKSSIASTQFRLGAAEIDVVLALVRAGTLAAAGERLRVDASTVFRALQRIERSLGLALFERGRAGYVATELARTLAEQGERVESALEAARVAARAQPDQVDGTVRITTTDTVLHGLVAPALKTLRSAHPLLAYEIHAGNELASLTRRDADIAVRATKRPPQHLVGKHVGPIRVAVARAHLRRLDDARANALPDRADDALRRPVGAVAQEALRRWRRPVASAAS